MTNIPPDLTMEKLQRTAHPRTYIMIFKQMKYDKEYWQKMWLLNRYAIELGFGRKYHP